MTPVAKRNAVVHLCETHGVRQRRACDVLQIDRSTVRYLSRRGDDTDLCDAIKRVTRERRWFGCRRIHVMIAREGLEVNHKKVRRIYLEEKLQVRRRGGRKRALGTRKPMVLPDGPNQRWSLDFVSDALTDGRRFRILAVVDDFSCENLVLVADTSLSGHRVARELDKVIAERGMPKTIVSDNGPEFTSMAILKWVQETDVDWHDFSRYIIAWKLCTNMRAGDVTDTIELALTASGCDQAVVPRKWLSSRVLPINMILRL